MRETVFNWLREQVAGAACLDLFAGTGALGLEALSRGAAEAWLVERDAALARALRAHVERLGAAARVLREDARRFLAHPPPDALGRFDVAFVDPPFDEAIEPLLPPLFRLLRPRALVYVERPAVQGLPDVPGAAWAKRRRAGAVEFGLLERE